MVAEVGIFNQLLIFVIQILLNVIYDCDSHSRNLLLGEVKSLQQNC